MSPDAPEKHRNFIKKHDLKITLLSDTEKKVMQQYNVWRLKKNYGRESMGVVRSTFIVNSDGNIAAIWDNVKVRQKRKKGGKTYEIIHAEQVLDKLKEMVN